MPRRSKPGAGAGVQVTADFKFDVPMQSGTDHVPVTVETFRLRRCSRSR
jgi:hypothetical protein